MVSEYNDHYIPGGKSLESESIDSRTAAKTLPPGFTVSMAASDLNKNFDRKKPDIKSVIYNDKYYTLHPQVDSDYSTNFKTPNKQDYRKKRSELLYPKHDEPSVSKNTKSEYRQEF